ncbi:hypothetical protein Pcinc_029555 [Petrolisthes cinctipes]|uniref:Uncharacterized protein n=1 Tax=Petrolisthes cinctipes TaxID=88211 RepID=A0AAE1K7M5_PETCI|nr:hypothetical protein Pcinc_029555 [Petrolisthes cinctipes]
MDHPHESLITTSHVAGTMNYPSSTQALFALIVMIIVLLFILVYCCWGTFSCARQDDASSSEESRTRLGSSQQPVPHFLQGGHAVIVPINNMIYVGDPESHRIFQIPLNQDKPPAYTEVYNGIPPPPYTTGNTSTPDPEPTRSAIDPPCMRRIVIDLPPSYNDCLHVPPNDQGVLSPEPEPQDRVFSEQDPTSPQPPPSNNIDTEETTPVASSPPSQGYSVNPQDEIVLLPDNLVTSDDRHPPSDTTSSNK